MLPEWFSKYIPDKWVFFRLSIENESKEDGELHKAMIKINLYSNENVFDTALWLRFGKKPSYNSTSIKLPTDRSLFMQEFY